MVEVARLSRLKPIALRAKLAWSLAWSGPAASHAWLRLLHERCCRLLEPWLTGCCLELHRGLAWQLLLLLRGHLWVMSTWRVEEGAAGPRAAIGLV